jgi:hypothetical protein
VGGRPSGRVGLPQTLRDWAEGFLSPSALVRTPDLFESPEWSRPKQIAGPKVQVGLVLYDTVLALMEDGVLEQREGPTQQWSFRFVRVMVRGEGNVE